MGVAICPRNGNLARIESNSFQNVTSLTSGSRSNFKLTDSTSRLGTEAVSSDGQNLASAEKEQKSPAQSRTRGVSSSRRMNSSWHSVQGHGGVIVPAISN